ncbi:MAG: tetratricopeptide repeat protein [Candidatus Pacebacteria bacterium]|nr:tetratricopeptide repeat protein [Candidatus Paceibacterota bacterium]
MYKNGEWFNARIKLKMAREAAMDLFSPVFAEELWAARYDIFKNENLLSDEKIAKYEGEVVPDCRLFLELTANQKRYVEERVSVIKLLLLIPGQNIKELCCLGIKDLKASDLAEVNKRNLEAEFLNSLAIPYKRTNTPKAVRILRRGLDLAVPGTVISGHLLQNLGDCFKNYFKLERGLDKEETCLKDGNEKDKGEAYIDMIGAYDKAIKCWNKALELYPKQNKEHRRSVQERIKSIEEEKDKI